MRLRLLSDTKLAVLTTPTKSPCLLHPLGRLHSPTRCARPLKAGGVGLNLTAATRVYLLDPWWNPAVEHQACDRVHRVGQTHPVHVVRFVARGTVEEKILELQRRKQLLCNSALGGADDVVASCSKDEARRLRLADLRLCFEAAPTGA